MTTPRSATERWLIGNPKSDLDTSCLPTIGDTPLLSFTFSTNDVKRTIKAVTEISVKSEIPMKSTWLHLKQLELKVF